ncbi:hypothetical protein [Streptomyces umbrinus]|uniref:hypothetical protein n=1 Tax=Streptomyces umbrinus TaxID=67370 RepID=UPI003435C05D
MTTATDLSLTSMRRRLDEPPIENVPGQLAVEVTQQAPAATAPAGLAAAFTARTRTTKDGHREWTGRATTGGGRFRHQGRDYTALRAAFILRTGRDPVGSVRPSCDRPTCCEPDHVDDQRTRQRDRAALAAVKGMQHRPPKCKHDQAIHGRHRADGKRYCAECNRQSSQPSCEHGNPTCRDLAVRPYPCGPRCDEHQPAKTRPFVLAAP